MKIINKLSKDQMNELFDLYINFFTEINYNELYSKDKIKKFAYKKCKDIKREKRNSKFFFCLEDNKIIGFIHGKIDDNIGLICHAYILPENRNKLFFLLLYKRLINWFKEKNVSIMEIEVDHNNPIIENVERYDWQLCEKYDDANVYQKSL